MTYFMDKLFIAIGLDETELKHSPIRGVLYMGMIFMTGLTTAFLIMAAIN